MLTAQFLSRNGIWKPDCAALGASRFVTAAGVAASGTALSLWGWGDEINLFALYAFTAAALFVSGGVTLALYLRRNPVQSGEEE